MNEPQWLTTTPDRMLADIPSVVWTERKRLLWAVAVGRRFLKLLSDERSRNAILTTELFVDGLVNLEKWREASGASYSARCDHPEDLDIMLADYIASCEDSGRLWSISRIATELTQLLAEANGPSCSPQQQCDLICELVGPLPYRPVHVDPAWQTATVIALAEAIYAERAFDRMPILADALEEAGCTCADILDHCRQPGEHVRGCWVVDLVLAKS